VGGLADLGLAGEATAPRRTLSHDDEGTQVLPVGPTSAPPAPTPVRGTDPGAGDRPRRPWVRILGAALVLLVAMGVAFVLGTHGDDDDDATGSASTETTPSQDASSPTASADEPSEAGMVDFVQDYIQTASSDPEAAFAMLTPAFQDESNGLSGYEGFWGDVRGVKLLDVSADPDTLEVSYTYRYSKPQEGATEDDVVLKLTYANGRYLIDQEL
jgi:hypothetical protein